MGAARNAVRGTIPVPRPGGVAVSPDGSKVYVTNSITFTGTVSVIDAATNTVSATIPVGPCPGGVAVSPDGTKVYVTIFSNAVSVIDTATNTVSATIPLGPPGTDPIGVAVSRDGSRVYVANLSGTVSVIDAATNTVGATIPLGPPGTGIPDRKSTPLNSSHQIISYAVFFLKKKKTQTRHVA